MTAGRESRVATEPAMIGALVRTTQEMVLCFEADFDV